MSAVLKPNAFRDEVRGRVWWDRAGRDSDAMARIVDEGKRKYVQDEAVEAVNKAMVRRNKRCCQDKPPVTKGGGQQASSPAPANAAGAFTGPL